MYLWVCREVGGARGELFPFSCVGVGCTVTLIEVLPLLITSEKKDWGESQSYAVTTPHCLVSGERDSDRHHTCTFGWSFNFVGEGRGEEISTSYHYHFPVPKLQQSMSSTMPEWSRGMQVCVGRRFLNHGHTNPSQQAVQNSSGSSLQLFCSSASLRAITEGSKSFLLICLQTQKLLHREREYSVPYNHNRQNEKQRVWLAARKFWESWQLHPGITWILQEGGHSPGWRNGLDELSSSPIFYDSQKTSLQSSITGSLIPATHSTTFSGTV